MPGGGRISCRLTTIWRLMFSSFDQVSCLSLCACQSNSIFLVSANQFFSTRHSPSISQKSHVALPFLYGDLSDSSTRVLASDLNTWYLVYVLITENLWHISRFYR